MQAVRLIDHQRYAIRTNALLRTDRYTGSTPDTGVRDEISLSFSLCAAEGEGRPLNRLLGKIEPFTAALIDVENGQRVHGRLCGIDLPHIRVLFKKHRYRFVTELSDLSSNGNRNRGHSRFALYCGQSKKATLLETVIEALAFCCEEI